MRPRSRAQGAGAIAAAVAASFTLATLARADTPPNRWDAIANTALADRYALHLRAREIMTSAAIAERSNDFAIALGLRNRARMFLEEGHAETSPDVVLRFDLGEVCYELEDNKCAQEVLERALAMAPDHPAALAAYSILANAYAKLDQSIEERRVYTRYIPRITDDVMRAIAMLNLAEANMHVGDLDDAVAGYRETIQAAAEMPNEIEHDQKTGLLARWGLAVALDRSGDVAGGAKETKFAIQLDTDMHEIRGGPNVFFAPERERYWYVALGFAEYAKQATEARTSALLWHRAEGCWRDYIQDVRMKAAPDRWIDLAHARLEKTHALRLAAERRVKGRIVYPQYDCAR
jgi:tetratricopeptide (TPR) repeat protein